ncbi:MAG: sulfatase-like hydrolase/transferase, partial [Planctomycetota bacterium]
MGFSDIGCYGGEIETPNLDGLAAGGVRFTQFYNGARCCPTRASLLTGLHPHQAGVGHMMSDRGYEGYRGDLNQRCRTIPEVLSTAGYRSYMSGKWHVAQSITPDGPKHNWPMQRGFSRFYGMISGAGSFYDPKSLVRDNNSISPLNDGEYQPDEYYFTDAISDNAVRYINDHTKNHRDQPFFLYVAYTAAHWPMQALERDIAKYKGRYDEGFDAIRESRLAKMKSLGLVDPDCSLSKGARDWDDVELKDWERRCMEVYAAMVDNMDQGIGRIVSSLKSADILDNTLIVFLQDNGGCAERYGRGKPNAAARGEGPAKLSPLPDDFHQLDMVPKQTRDGRPYKTGDGVMPGPDGTYIAYGKGWANVSNTPFREYK